MEAVGIAAGQTEQAVTPWLPAFIMGCHRAPLLGFVHCLQTQGMDNSKITAPGKLQMGQFVSSLVLEVSFVLELCKKQVIDQVWSVPWWLHLF